jgi:hypothetical protein
MRDLAACAAAAAAAFAAEARIAALPTVEQVDDDIMSRIDSGKCDSMGIIKTLRRVLDERDDLLRDLAARAEKAERECEDLRWEVARTDDKIGAIEIHGNEAEHWYRKAQAYRDSAGKAAALRMQVADLRSRAEKTEAALHQRFAHLRAKLADAEGWHDRPLPEKLESLADGLSYNSWEHEGAAKHWLHELAGLIRSKATRRPDDVRRDKQIADLTRERDAARRDARKLARRLLADLCAPKWEERAGGIIQVEGRDEMRDELEKLRKYALLDSTHWEKLGDPKECAFPEGWSPPQPRPDYVPPDREDPHDLHRLLRVYESGYDPLCSTPLQWAVYALCRIELARGEGGR